MKTTIDNRQLTIVLYQLSFCHKACSPMLFSIVDSSTSERAR